MKTSMPAFVLLLLSVTAFAGPIENLKPGEWYEVPNSHMTNVDPCPSGSCSYSGASGFHGIMDAWCGGAFDTKRDRLIVWGGGHQDYAGNEIYVFDLNTLQWTRENNPDTPIMFSAYTQEGTPSSRHTYDCLLYVTSIDRFCSFGGGAVWGDGNQSFRHTDAFNFNTNQWQKLADCPVQDLFCAYDPVSGAAWAGRGTMARFDAVKNQWGKQTVDDNGLGYEYGITLELDPKRRLLLSVGHGKVYTWDISNLNASISAQVVSTTGDNSMVGLSAPGLAYDPVTESMIGWNGGASVYSLNPATKVWTKRSPTNAVTPTAANSNGTFGRFRYCPSKNVFVAVNRTGDNVFVYKLTADAAAPQWYLDLLNGNGTTAEKNSGALNENLSVFPNPFRSSIAIALPEGQTTGAVLTIYDVRGKTVAHLIRNQERKTSNLLHWNAPGLPAGVYVVERNTGGVMKRQKVTLLR